MPVTLACPNCEAHLDAPDDIEGRKVECKKCGEKFRARPIHMVSADGSRGRRGDKSESKSRRHSRDRGDEDQDERSSRRTGEGSRRREDDHKDRRDEGKDRPRRTAPEEGDQEDEPRARKKKGKKKKKSLSPVVKLIVGGVALLLLIAGIGAWISRDKSDDSVSAGGPVSGPSAGDGSAGDPAVPGWLEFADPNGQFKVRLPRTPAAPLKQLWPLPNGEQADATIYTVEIGGGLYSVAYLVVPGRDAGAPADPVLDDVFSRGTGWIKGSVIKSKTNVTHQGFPAREAVLEYPGVKGSTILRVTMAGNRMFWMLAKGENFAADTPKVKGFLDSLKIN
jgi:DNA-directed RNA polymerase subunit M/transcription elongation factor TFIIS